MGWTTPKTNWTKNDFFNLSDYNRIKNNLVYLKTLADEIYTSFNTPNLGGDISDYEHIWTPDEFNNIETVLENIFNASSLTISIGSKATFSNNGLFIQYGELNRIESAILQMRNRMENQAKYRKHLSYTLGGVQF